MGDAGFEGTKTLNPSLVRVAANAWYTGAAPYCEPLFGTQVVCCSSHYHSSK